MRQVYLLPLHEASGDEPGAEGAGRWAGRTKSAARDEACGGDCNVGGAHNPEKSLWSGGQSRAVGLFEEAIGNTTWNRRCSYYYRHCGLVKAATALNPSPASKPFLS